MNGRRESYSDRESGGVKPAKSSGKSSSSGGGSSEGPISTERTQSGTTANEGATAKHTMSTVGHVKQRPTSLEACEAECPSGRSDIDPGGSEYNSKSGSTDQD